VWQATGGIGECTRISCRGSLTYTVKSVRRTSRTFEKNIGRRCQVMRNKSEAKTIILDVDGTLTDMWPLERAILIGLLGAGNGKEIDAFMPIYRTQRMLGRYALRRSRVAYRLSRSHRKSRECTSAAETQHSTSGTKPASYNSRVGAFHQRRKITLRISRS